MAKGNIMAVKKLFFDRPAVMRLMSKETYRALNRFGGYVRRVARNSIRRRKKTSEPGSPPSAHAAGNYGLKEIYYSYDPQNMTVVIGPVKYNSGELSESMTGMGDSLTTMRLLEEGGVARRRVARIEENGKVQWVSSPDIPDRLVRYRPRPFMGPAYETAIEKMPSMWTRIN